jgi:hypothetical protein
MFKTAFQVSASHLRDSFHGNFIVQSKRQMISEEHKSKYMTLMEVINKMLGEFTGRCN